MGGEYWAAVFLGHGLRAFSFAVFRIWIPNLELGQRNAKVRNLNEVLTKNGPISYCSPKHDISTVNTESSLVGLGNTNTPTVYYQSG